MNVIVKLVKGTVLVPYRVVQGVGAAVDEIVSGPKPDKREKD